jgi:hypothetical protein
MLPLRRFAPIFALVATLGGLVSACGGDSPTRPGRAHLPSGSASPTRVELMAPESVTPGETLRVTLLAYHADGSIRDVTRDATYTSSNTNVLEWRTAGRITAHAAGEASVSATYSTLRDVRLMFAMPLGTFRLTGVVTNGGSGVDGAEVTVLSGAGAGLTAVTTSAGQYRIYGVGGDTRVQVRKRDFAPNAQTIDIGEHSYLNFELLRDHEGV